MIARSNLDFSELRHYSSCVSNDIQPHDVTSTGWLKMGISARKGVDACTVTGGVDLAGKAGVCVSDEFFNARDLRFFLFFSSYSTSPNSSS